MINGTSNFRSTREVRTTGKITGLSIKVYTTSSCSRKFPVICSDGSLIWPGPLCGLSVPSCKNFGVWCIPRCPDLQGWCIPRCPRKRIAPSIPSSAGSPLSTPVRISAVFNIHTQGKPYRRIPSPAERYTEIVRPISRICKVQFCSS